MKFYAQFDSEGNLCATVGGTGAAPIIAGSDKAFQVALEELPDAPFRFDAEAACVVLLKYEGDALVDDEDSAPIILEPEDITVNP